MDATRRLGQGELGTRTGLAHGRDEIGQLAGAFDEMAATLHARNTEFERVMEALGDSEERFRTLVETTSDWIWEVDATGVYTYASPKVKDLLGYAPEEAVGKTPFDFMPPDEAAKVRRQFAEIAAARRPFERLENVNLHKDGRRVVLETSGVPIFDHDGGFMGYRGIDRDITERIKAQENSVTSPTTTSSPTCPTARCCSTACGRDSSRPHATAGGWRRCAWTCGTSRISTTRWATRPATACFRPRPSGCRPACARAIPSRAWAATNSE